MVRRFHCAFNRDNRRDKRDDDGNGSSGDAAGQQPTSGNRRDDGGGDRNRRDKRDDDGSDKAEDKKNGSDKEQPSEMFTQDGRFSDTDLEDAYQTYVERKQRSGEKPRERAEWKEAHDIFWSDNSAPARGRKFNETAGLNYDYNEIHLQNGKRLDSYDPGNEIVSRKAIDFDNLEESDFKGYLSECLDKYAPGTIIRSNKYPFLDGKPLEGDLVLEVPDTNQTAKNRSHFESLAASKSIRIKYTLE